MTYLVGLGAKRHDWEVRCFFCDTLFHQPEIAANLFYDKPKDPEAMSCTGPMGHVCPSCAQLSSGEIDGLVEKQYDLTKAAVASVAHFGGVDRGTHAKLEHLETMLREGILMPINQAQNSIIYYLSRKERI